MRIGGITTTRGGIGTTAGCAGARGIRVGATTVGVTGIGRVNGDTIAGASAGNSDCNRAGEKSPALILWPDAVVLFVPGDEAGDAFGDRRFGVEP